MGGASKNKRGGGKYRGGCWYATETKNRGDRKTKKKIQGGGGMQLKKNRGGGVGRRKIPGVSPKKGGVYATKKTPGVYATKKKGGMRLKKRGRGG